MLPTLLKIRGFKSFALPEVVPLNLGLNGIVGPNGCGKSNIVDALRWLMGERFAKRLRGEKSEELLFAGSRDHHAIDIAEVQIRLNPHAHGRNEEWDDVEEVVIERRMVRNEGINYSINGKQALSRDVQLFFSDIGLSSDGSAIVGQGQVAAIISSRGEDRRMLLEDVAGTRGLLFRRRESINKLNAAERNMERVEEIITLELKQLGKLKSEAKKSLRYKKLTTEIEKLKAIAVYSYWRDQSKELEKTKQDLATINQKLEGFFVDLSQHQNNTIHAEKNKDLADQEHQKNNRNYHFAKLELERATGDFKSAQEKRDDLIERLEAYKDDCIKIESYLGGLVEELNQEESSLNDGDRKTVGGKKVLEEKESVYQGALTDYNNATNSKNAIQSEIISLERALKNFIQAKEKKLKQRQKLEAEQDSLIKKIDLHKSEQDVIKNDSDKLAKEIAQDEKEAINLNQLKDNLYATFNSLQKPITETRRIFEEKEEEFDNKISNINNQIQNLKAEIRAFENVFVSFGSAKDGAQPREKVANKITFPSKYIKAIAAFLAGDGDADIASTMPENHSHVWLKRQDCDYSSAYVSKLTNLFEVVEEAPEALADRLKSTGLADNLADASKHFSELSPGSAIVTMDGWRITSDGVINHLDSKSNNKDYTAKILEAEQRIRSAQKEIIISNDEKTKITAEWEKEKEQQKQSSEAQLKKIELTSDKIKETERKIAEISQLKERKERQITDYQHKKTRLIESVDWNNDRLQQIKLEYSDSESDDAEVDEIKKQIDQNQGKLQEIKNNINQLAETLNQKAKERDEIKQEQFALENQAKYSEKRIQDLQASINEDKNRLHNVQQKIESLSLEVEKLNSNSVLKSTLEEHLGDISVKILNYEEDLKKSSDELSLTNEKLIEIKSKEKEILDNVKNTEIEKATLGERVTQTDIKIYDLAQRIKSEFNQENPARLCEMYSFEDSIIYSEEDEQNLKSYTSKRDQLGGVNLIAEQQVEESESEIEVRNVEKNKIQTAIDEFKSSVTKIDKEAEESITKAFTELNRNFHDIFVRLFGGGRARLELTDPDNLIESSIDIFASPPGKRLTSLRLLSGGEQALTALSLLLARFQASPAPLCVLDEVDAALDDSNVERLLDLLEDMFTGSYESDKTPVCCLMISHHRYTISRAKKLIGVTMPNAGVSCIVNVSLDQAIEYIEQNKKEGVNA